MLTVYVICEGQTEETFIKEVLLPHFMPKLHLIPVTLKGNVKIERILSNVKKLLLRRDAYCTTLFDFYGLPPDFPGMAEATRLKIIQDKARCITRAMHEHSQQVFHENFCPMYKCTSLKDCCLVILISLHIVLNAPI